MARIRLLETDREVSATVDRASASHGFEWELRAPPEPGARPAVLPAGTRIAILFAQPHERDRISQCGLEIQ